MGSGKASTGQHRRGPSRGSLALRVLAAAGLHAFAFFLMRALVRAPAAGDVALPIGVSLLFAVTFSMMVSQGLKASIEVLFERGDLDLLLSSPLPSRSIFTVRLAAIVIATASLYLFLLAPFAHAGAVLGQPRWLAIYPVVLGAAALAASLSMLLTLALVRVAGIRRTRVLAQVLGALVGALFFLLSQVYANTMGSGMPRLAMWIEQHAGASGALDSGSMLLLPARAVFGDPLALLAIAAVGSAAFALTVHFTHGFFVHGVQQAVSRTSSAAAPKGVLRFRFGRSLAITVMRKEWKLIARDPQLISQVLLQLLYLLPLCFMLIFKAATVLPGLGASLTFLCTSLTTALAWLIIAAEDAPDLLRASPASAATIARAKLATAVTPAIVLMAAPLCWVALRQPWSALLLALGVGGATVSAALLVRWGAPPAARSDFRRRPKGNFGSNVSEFGSALLWAGLSWVMLALAQPGKITILVALAGAVLFTLLFGLLSLAWLRRQRP